MLPKHFRWKLSLAGFFGWFLVGMGGGFFLAPNGTLDMVLGAVLALVGVFIVCESYYQQGAAYGFEKSLEIAEEVFGGK